MPTPRFSIRVDPAVLTAWRSAAEAKGQTISAWLHDAATAHLAAIDRKHKPRILTDKPVATPKAKPVATRAKRDVISRLKT